jgi:hypothetical protein
LNIHPANLIRPAYSRNKLWFRQYQWLYECSHLEQAKRIKGENWSKNDETSPINLAVTSGNENKEFYREFIHLN